MGTFPGSLPMDDPIVGQDPDRIAHDPGKSRDKSGTIIFFEFLNAALIYDAHKDFSGIYGLSQINGRQTIELPGIIAGFPGRLNVHRLFVRAGKPLEYVPAYAQGILIIFSHMISHPGYAGMYFSPSQLFVGYFLSCGSLHQWWAPNENSSLIANNDGFIAHGWHISSSRCA